ncbi:zinc ribbon domain-containing protein [Chloracidobacterium aggregatum]|jgi:hypothetical protein|uniref:Zinc-ribbon domain-containing protein n=1 Tax=Chloracidobacterium sp. N TaxID=2821540 RepID=A0ABX8AWT6_9BACT|nr:zinc ribbon domain-containing protein [Chloracidobacterium aggregatum]QUV84484.1 hypothetical protein J8C03_10155 [Chloracidobacterium sp. 2]QUV87021.1 hypothetical protein J8C07_07385 [Chloracidobacterium sp. S]QUV89932.1 hypothetical protein J8C04_06470 [Chloracidobacterium sp. A]QUV93143.1 hypothetical protein J8C05_07080 [Chloracidobacterium sp. N]QUV96297.1 hypothetical protein J8C00_08210 [Chloracidobacterium sp. E]
MKIVCPECQTEAAPGMKFCRNCGEKLPDPLASAPTVVGTALPPPDLARTVESPAAIPPSPPPEAFKTVVGQAVTPPKPPPDAFKTVVGQAVTPPKPPPDALKTVVGQAVTPPKPPPDALKTVVGQAVPAAAPSQPTSSGPAATEPEPAQELAADSGRRFVYLMLTLVALGFLAGLALFVAVYVFGEKPTPATPAARTGTEFLDASITRIELCSFRVLPTEPDAFDFQAASSAFPAGIRAVAIRVSGRTRPDGDYRVVWRRLETAAPLMAQSIQSLTESQQAVRLLYQPDGMPLSSGAYLVEIQDGDRPLARAYFTIGLPAKP